ncbi:MAG: hypothetical protein QXG65_04705 [Thermoplasmata archaeon]
MSARAEGDEATAQHPRRRRTPWSLRSIVVDVTGRPIADFQDPEPPQRAPLPRAAPAAPDAAPGGDEPGIDPVERVHPPLSRANARRYHGPAAEHPPAGTGPTGPASPARPERVYLHYLLLHLDRLPLADLWYLRRQVNEEIAGRAAPPKAPR